MLGASLPSTQLQADMLIHVTRRPMLLGHKEFIQMPQCSTKGSQTYWLLVLLEKLAGNYSEKGDLTY